MALTIKALLVGEFIDPKAMGQLDLLYQDLEVFRIGATEYQGTRNPRSFEHTPFGGWMVRPVIMQEQLSYSTMIGRRVD